MSGEALGHVYRFSQFSGATHDVLVAVGDTVNDVNNNEFWMAVSNLARKTRKSPATVKRALIELVETGWLEVLVSGRETGGPTLYRFVFDDHRPVVFDTRGRVERQGDGRIRRAEVAHHEPPPEVPEVAHHEPPPTLEVAHHELGVAHHEPGVAHGELHNPIEPNATQTPLCPPTGKPAGSRPKLVGNKIGDGYSPPVDDVERFIAQGHDHDGDRFVAETEIFIDHWKAQGRTKSDWDAAWRNWIRKRTKRRPAGASKTPTEWTYLGDEAGWMHRHPKGCGYIHERQDTPCPAT